MSRIGFCFPFSSANSFLFCTELQRDGPICHRGEGFVENEGARHGKATAKVLIYDDMLQDGGYALK
jgi:hypothetical protein